MTSAPPVVAGRRVRLDGALRAAALFVPAALTGGLFVALAAAFVPLRLDSAGASGTMCVPALPASAGPT